jgi:glycosyltransferase involved in cell wall biosynthesis
MNILFLSMTFPDAVHRTRGSYNFALCRELAKSHDVRIVSPRPWTEALTAKRRGQVFRAGDAVEAAGLRASYPTYWYLPFVTRNQSGRILWETSRAAVETMCRDWRPDLVLSYWAHPDGEAGLRAAQKYGAKSAVIVGGTDALELPYRRGRGPHVRRVLTESDFALTVSDGLRQAVLKIGADPQRVHVFSQGVDPNAFHVGDQQISREALGLANNRPVLVWVGRMVPVKRLDVLVEACSLLRNRNIAFELRLVGDGPTRKAAEKLVAARGLGDVIRFVGSVPYQETANWYRAADATVLCSDSEGLPNVLRESLACGTPFVSTDVGSIREVAEPGASVLTPRGDAAALADGIQEILKPTYRALAQKYRPQTWTDCAADVLSIVGASSVEKAPSFHREMECVG